MDFDGKFIWNELMTSDVEAAKAFYAAVGRWTYQDMPSPDGETYTVCNLPGAPMGVAGISYWPDDRPGGKDWMPYMGTTDIKASMVRLVEAGGKVIRDVFTVPNTGDIAIVEDPTGAVFGLLQPVPM